MKSRHKKITLKVKIINHFDTVSLTERVLAFHSTSDFSLIDGTYKSVNIMLCYGSTVCDEDKLRLSLVVFPRF